MKEFFDIQATIESGFTLKPVRDMTRTYRHILYKGPQRFRFSLNASDLYLKPLNLLSNMVLLLDVIRA